MHHYYSHGKLLIAGEYLVLRGALALAIPCKFGQIMEVVEAPNQLEETIKWVNKDEFGKVWADVLLSKKDFLPINSYPQNCEGERLALIQKILSLCKQLNPQFLTSPGATSILNTLQFSRYWGLGSSSTLINNIAQYAQVNAIQLNTLVFKGSGYDIACAQSTKPILYKIDAEGPVWDTVHFSPPQRGQLFFVYLGKKQISKNEIAQFSNQKNKFEEEIDIISEISEALLFCDDFTDFMALLNEHEDVMSTVLQKQKIKDLLFAHFNGSIKSLGAWGGDFILVASTMSSIEVKNYFTQKGFPILLNYDEMALAKI